MIDFNSPKLRAASYLEQARTSRNEGDKKAARYCLERAAFWREVAKQRRLHKLAYDPIQKQSNELLADLFAAHAHIEHLHGLVKKYNLRKITEVVSAWEDSQCQL